MSFNKTPQILYSEIVFSKQDLYYYWGSFIFVLGVIGASFFMVGNKMLLLLELTENGIMIVYLLLKVH